MEKIIKLVSKINTIFESPTEEKLKKQEVYVKKILKITMSLTSKDQDYLNSVLKELCSLHPNFFKTIGDEIISYLWKLYDFSDTYQLLKASFEGDTTTNLLNVFFEFNTNLQSLIKEDVISIRSEDNKVHFNKSIKEFSKIPFTFDSKQQENNFHLDMLILYIFSSSELKNVYITLSSFIATTHETNLIQLFKLISLFGLSIYQIEEKENFIDSLLYAVGGVMASHAISYANTKNKMSNFKLVECKMHVIS